MRRMLIHLFVLAAALGVARAQEDPRSALEGAGRLPAEVDIVVAMEDARDFSRSSVGAALLEMVVRGGGFNRTRAAWAALAGQLNMTSDEAVDALLSERTVFAARWSERGGLSWALLADVAPEVERRVRKALRPAPREVIAGRPVLAVEGGVMEMVLAGDRERPRLLLGPATDQELFLEIASTLDAGPEKSFGQTRLFREIERVGRHPDGLLLFRSPGERELWFSVVADQSDLAVDMIFLVGVPELAERGAAIEPWSRQTFERLARGAYVVILDMNELSWGEEGQGAQQLAGMALPLELPPELLSLLSDRFALVVRPGEVGPVEVALALETVDTLSMAREGDRLLCRQLQGLAGGEKACRKLEGLERMPATAVRTVDLSPMLGSWERFGWKAGPHVSWRSRIDEAHCNVGQHRGWWTVGVGPAAVAELGRVVTRDEEEGGLSQPWLSLGLVRPSALIERLEEADVPIPPVLEPLRCVRELRWQAMESGRGVLLGYARVEVEDAAMARGK